MFERHSTPAILEALSDTPVVFIRGARQTGKTTLVRKITERDHPAQYFNLDSPAVLSAATTDPAGFIRGAQATLAIDEVQRAPDLILAIKEDVDRNRKPGRYLLTGSANVLTIPTVAESLAGRMEIVTLWPLSQGEIAGKRENFLERLFKPGPGVFHAGETSLGDLVKSITAGGYPEPLQRPTQKRRAAWFDSYLTTIIERDLRSLANIHDISAIPRLLKLLASRTANIREQSALSRNTGIPNSTLGRYMAMLEAVFIVYTLPAWTSNLGRRLVKAPKLYFTDTGIACFLLGIEPDRLLDDHALAGGLFENFVVSELCKQAAWCEFRVRLHHFRSHMGHEVDVVAESGTGAVCGIEIKLSSTVSAKHFSGLKELQKISAKRFTAGVVLYTGSEVIPFGERLFAIPVSTLWQPGIHSP